jgi:hypothetical protein
MLRTCALVLCRAAAYQSLLKIAHGTGERCWQGCDVPGRGGQETLRRRGSLEIIVREKAQGKQLGNSKLVAAAVKRDKVLRPMLQKLAGQSLRAIAAELDRRGIKSWSGKPWNAVIGSIPSA